MPLWKTTTLNQFGGFKAIMEQRAGKQKLPGFLRIALVAALLFPTSKSTRDTRKLKTSPSMLKFKITENKEFEDAYLLVWTTTPWTLPGNVALAVNKDLEYSFIKTENNEEFVLATDRLFIIEQEYKTIRKFKGSELIGLKYEPLFDLSKKEKVENIKNAYQVFSGDFVSNEDGTGIVHMNPMYGEDDFNVGKEHELPFFHTVDTAGKFKKEVADFQGLPVKEADPKIIENLKERNILFKEELVTHDILSAGDVILPFVLRH
jgi:isoleucyl-tRNA synthetase